MDSRTVRVCVAVAIVAVLAAGVGILCLNSGYEHTKDSFEVTVLGNDSYNNYVIDLTDEKVEAHGMKLGEQVELNIGGKICKGQMTTLTSGTPLFGIFIDRVASDEYVFGMFCYDVSTVFDLQPGSTFTLTHEGIISEQVQKIPNYMSGYSDNPEDFYKAEYYANFREIVPGDLKDDTFYRSASPYSTYGTQRHIYVDRLLEEAGVECLLLLNVNLADIVDSWPTDCYSYKLLQEGKVIAIKFSPAIFNYEDQAALFMETIASTEGKINISCALGKDRTGYYVAMLEALAGATYSEIRDDFMTTLCNFYDIKSYSEEYETLACMLIDPFFYILEHPEILSDPTVVDWSHLKLDVDSVDAYGCVYSYLTQRVGVSEEVMQSVLERILA